MAEVMMAKAKPKGDFILPHLSLPFLPSKHKKKKEKQEYDELGENNLAGISGLGEVGRPDWMEQVDSSDDDNGGLMKDRTNFDLKKNKIGNSPVFLIFNLLSLHFCQFDSFDWIL